MYNGINNFFVGGTIKFLIPHHVGQLADFWKKKILAGNNSKKS
jgi:hypothetical protein